MSTETDTTPNPDTGPPDDADDTTGPDGTDGSLPMERVNQLIAREGRKAAKKAKAELLAELGIDDVDTLKGQLQQQREREDAERSDLERATARAAELERANQETAARLARAELRQQISEALAVREDGAIRPERLSLALDIAVPHALSSDDDDVVAAAVAHVAGASPEWFSSSDADDDGSGHGGRTPPIRSKGPGDRGPKPKSAAARGAEAAKKFGGEVIAPIPSS